MIPILSMIDYDTPVPSLEGLDTIPWGTSAVSQEGSGDDDIPVPPYVVEAVRVDKIEPD